MSGPGEARQGPPPADQQEVRCPFRANAEGASCILAAGHEGLCEHDAIRARISGRRVALSDELLLTHKDAREDLHEGCVNPSDHARLLADCRESQRQKIEELTSALDGYRAGAISYVDHDRQVADLRGEVARLRAQLDKERMDCFRLHVAAKEEQPADEDQEHRTTLALDAARQIVLGERARTYGKPSENHYWTAWAWTGYLRLPPGFLDERDVCQMNILQKVVRDRHLRGQDNLTDEAGYAQNASWVGDPRHGKNLDEVLGLEEAEQAEEIDK